MATDPKPLLASMSVDELRALAASHRVDTTGLDSKEALVEALAKGGVQPRPPSLEALLLAMKLKDLREVASRHVVDVAKLRKKKDIAEAILTSPVAQAVYDELRPHLEAPPAPAAPPMPPVDDPEADVALYAGKNAEVDFDRAEDLLDQARMRYEERNFERAIAAAEEAGQLTRGNSETFQRAAWAYAILSCQRLVEDCGKAGREVDEAAALLLEVKRAFKGNSLGARADLLARLEEVSRNLYSQEIQRSRQEIYRVQEALSQVANTGANVLRADEVLTHARDALRRNDPLLALSLSSEAERTATDALKTRIREIEAAIPATETIIAEARNVGADVSESGRWLEKARIAVSEKEYVLAAELVKRAERAAMQSQHHQIEKAMELRRKQVEKAQEILNAVEPLVDEAHAFDVDVTEARTLVRQARDVLAKGDYVNGTVYARNAAEIVRRLEPKVVEERKRRGILKPEAGVCAGCGSRRLVFEDDGSGRCVDCGRTFRWRVPSSLWDRFVSAIRD